MSPFSPFTFGQALQLFESTLASERGRPHIHAAMRALALPEVITPLCARIQQSLLAGARVWMTSDLHFNHANVIQYCNRPFANVTEMNQHLLSQVRKIPKDEWLILIGDLAMGDHAEAMQWIRQIPGRKVLVAGNHDFKRDGRCLYLQEEHEGQPLFEAVVPFLYWEQPAGQRVLVSHYPAIAEREDAVQLLHYHGHLHRDVLQPNEHTHYSNVGWDVAQAVICV